MPRFQILLVEDDPNTSAMVSEVLRGEGFDVCAAETAGAARAQFEKSSEFDIVVLDRSLPDADGIELCAEMRHKSSLRAIPVLFLTAKGSVADKVEGLQTGGDDYLAKPFNPAELVARVQALLRRSGRMGKPVTLESGSLRLDLEGRKAYVKNKPVELWAKEFDLLALLLSQKNRVMSREFLLQEIWGYSPESEPATKVVDVTVSHLRAKLGAYGDRVATVRGFGYRLDTD